MINMSAIQAEIQKLNSQKQYFEQTIAELEKNLQDAIDTADTTDRDAKYVSFCVFAGTFYCIDTLIVTVT